MRAKRQRHSDSFKAKVALAALAFDRPFKYATIVSDADSLGHVLFAPWRTFRPDASLDPRTTARIDATVLGMLAGYTAEWKYTGHRNRRGAASDFEQAYELAGYWHDGDTLEAYIGYMTLRARDFTWSDLCWKQIEAVAAALMESGRLKQDEVRQVIQKAHGIRELTLPKPRTH